MILPFLLSAIAAAFFGWQLIATMRELNEIELERDALWDELRGIDH